MFEGYFTKYLKEGEEVISIERRYYLTFVFQAALALMLVLIPFFFLFPLFRLGGFGVLSFFALLLLGLVVLTRQGVMYYLNGLVITKERIMDFDQRGLFNRVVSETTYAKIQDVSFEIKGVLQTMLNYGNLEIQTAGAQANLEIKDVAEPKRIQELITRLQTETVAPPKDLSAAELVKMVDTIKEGLGEEHFNRLLKDSPKSSLKPKSRRSQ